MVNSEHEAEFLLAFVKASIAMVCAEQGYLESDVRCQLGVLIETPRAVLRAYQIASLKDIDFVVIGSNELTQCIYGVSKDDKEHFLVSL